MDVSLDDILFDALWDVVSDVLAHLLDLAALLDCEGEVWLVVF